ncbi:MAG: serine/threonine-protein kinase [Pseudomonadota bacterium]
MGRSILNHLKDPLIGTMVQQRYQVVRRIGSGAVVDVYLARQQILGGRRVALRVLKPALAARDGEAGGAHLRRFFNEVQLACLFKGPAFAGFIDGGMTGPGPERPFVVQELLEGPLLSELVAAKTLSWREGTALVLQLCAATEELHAYGVLYRDFSPSNVIVEEQRGVGRVARLFDFSHATLEGVSLLDAEGSTEDLAGSPVYSAPELGSPGEPPGRSVDTFSLGALLYLACTGRAPVRLPHSGDWRAWADWAGSGQPVPEIPFREVAPKAPAALGRVVTKALSVNPSTRYPEARTLAADLRQLLGLKGYRDDDAGGFSLSGLLGKLRR